MGAEVDKEGVHPTILAQAGKRTHHVVVDWDGTLVENKWPGMGDWMPGAVEAMRAFHRAGIKLVVFSARLSPFDPWTGQERDKGLVQGEYLKVRAKLDEGGLSFVDIWRLPGKPGGSVYIDDRAERYTGMRRSWEKMTEKVLTRLGLWEPEFPEFDQEVALGDA